MGKATKPGAPGKLARMLLPLLLCACACPDPTYTDFDIAAQPAASALNEFAQQADVTLVFSYDAVAGMRSQALRGRFPVDEGLARLLQGTPLLYRKSGDGGYLVCPPAHCNMATGVSVPPTLSPSTPQ